GDIVAEDPVSGNVIFDMSSLLSDQLDLQNIVNENLPPAQNYRLDPALSYVDSAKAFPQNDVITVAQTWSTQAKHVIDTAPDARRLRIDVVYNFIQPPNDDYRPRLADDRVGIYDDIYLDFANDRRGERRMRYLIRWNFDPEDPAHPSRARHPMVITLSNSIPTQYRKAITEACLEWNKAFAKIGILDAVRVQPQPADPNFDPDDFRYNVIRWLNEARPGFGADSQTLFDPRTGEEIRTGVIVSAIEGLNAYNTWKYRVDPVRYARNTDPVPAKFVHDVMFSTLLHEMGHNMGLQHNFIGSMAYTAKDLQSMAFTDRYGITSTAMEYAPLNLWPRGTPQGEYFQTTLGPYDYYAIKYGYAYIPGASTPQAEEPTLERWAAGWSNPSERYDSDEDAAWYNGHAADPRSQEGDLTSDPLAWCGVQMNMDRGQFASLNRLWPLPGHSYQEETNAFAQLLGGYLNCPIIASHFIGGQYLSRAHRGDPGAHAAIRPVPLSQERRAFELINTYLFRANALNVRAQLRQHLGYAEWAGYGYTGWEGYGNLPLWAYNPPARHDYPLIERINSTQMRVIDYLFQPIVLQRIDENPQESATATMSIADLFDWLHAAVFEGLGANDVPLVRRNLQSEYLNKLVEVANTPAKDTPADAQALARAQLQRIAHDARQAQRARHDAVTSAHLSELIHRADAALKT
ncbi:MAG TPA: zinc-dependent metalloprotease, partial [Candidatus Baltobacteraceae bacterium]|nr:zinc-dependent metalloprotease [Candidatus Baltobacteraceae bacterium]